MTTTRIAGTWPLAGQAPSLSRRMACFVYEGMMLFGLLLIPGAIGALFVAVTGSAHPLVLEVIAFVVFGIYFTWFWSRRGQTLPMQTWHILVLTTSGQPLSQPRALLRYAASCAWFAPAWLIKVLNHWTGWDGIAALGIGVVAYALLALLHPQRQFWHDAICGTQLIDAKPEPRRKP